MKRPIKWVPEVADVARELYQQIEKHSPDHAALVKRLGTAKLAVICWRKILPEKLPELFRRACFINTKTLKREEFDRVFAEHGALVEKVRNSAGDLNYTEEERGVLLQAAEILERKVRPLVGYVGPWITAKHKVDPHVRGYALALGDVFEELLGDHKSWDKQVAAITSVATQREVSRETVRSWRTYVGKQTAKN